MTKPLLLATSKLMLAALIFTAPPAAAEDYTLGSLEIEQPWTRALPAVSRNGAAYMTIRNGGESADRLIAVASPGAERSEIHESVADADGVMRMRHREAAEIPPGGELRLEPNGYHVMLMGLNEPLVEGESLPLTLTFEEAGEIEVSVEIRSLRDGNAGHGHGHGNHEHDHHGHGEPEEHGSH